MVSLSEGGAGLSSSVLVLNRYYLAVHVIGARRAICLLVRELAEVIHCEEGQFCNYDFSGWLAQSELRSELRSPHDDFVRSVHFELQIPRVVRLLKFDRLPRNSVRFSRRSIFARDEQQCMYCGGRFPISQLSLDHVLPKSRGGKTTWENVVSSCVTCNVKKGGRTPQEARMRLVRPPSRPKRNPLLALKLRNPKYACWKPFLDHPQAAVDVF